jgi:hypothetical protein
MLCDDGVEQKRQGQKSTDDRDEARGVTSMPNLWHGRLN